MSWYRRLPWTRWSRERKEHALCRKALTRVHELVDGELPNSGEARALIGHVERCPQCRDRADEVAALKQAIGRACGRTDPRIQGSLEELADRLCRPDD